MPQIKDYASQRFGKFTVLEFYGRFGSHTKWLCRCDCGIVKAVCIQHLRDGDTVSCGCHRREVGKRMIAENGLSKQSPIFPTGMRFGRWTVIRKDEARKRPKFYICRCDCGIVRSVGRRSLLVGDSKSCGCLHKEVSSRQAIRLFTKHGKCKDPEYIRFLKRRRYHADRAWTHKMDVLLFSLQPACVICQGTDNLEIDHVVPASKGGKLEPGNAVVLCLRCNRIKFNKDLSRLPTEWQDKIQQAAQEFAKAWASQG